MYSASLCSRPHLSLALRSPTSAITLAAVTCTTVLIARGFGAREVKGKGEKGGSVERKKRKLKRLKGKVIGCATCKGSGKKPCLFCKGTTRMVGFLGADVACVPCGAAGTMGRPCVECRGMGFFTP